MFNGFPHPPGAKDEANLSLEFSGITLFDERRYWVITSRSSDSEDDWEFKLGKPAMPGARDVFIRWGGGYGYISELIDYQHGDWVPAINDHIWFHWDGIRWREIWRQISKVHLTSYPYLDQSIDPTWTGHHTFNWLTVNSGTISVDQKRILEGTVTWNNAAINFNSIYLRVTATAYGSGSKLIDVGTVSGGGSFSVSALGSVNASGVITAGGGIYAGAVDTIGFSGRSRITSGSDGTMTISNLNIANKFTNLTLGMTYATANIITVQGASGSGTDSTGNSISLEGGAASGTAPGGFVRLRTANKHGTTGSTSGGMSTRYHAVPAWVDLTESSATLILKVAIAYGKHMGIKLFLTVNASDGTELQSISSDVRFDAVNKAGTVSVGTVSQSDTAGVMTSGTLSVTYTAVSNGNSVDIKANAVSSLSQTILRCTVVVVAMNTSGTGEITEQ